MELLIAEAETLMPNFKKASNKPSICRIKVCVLKFEALSCVSLHIRTHSKTDEKLFYSKLNESRKAVHY